MPIKFNEMSKKNTPLTNGARVDDYEILKSLGGGGFSIVYLAQDQSTGKKVAIKEYVPFGICNRDLDGEVIPIGSSEQEIFNQGRKSFIKEARMLSGLKHPTIVNVVNFFQANGTVYMVMDYEEGTNLQYYIKKRKGQLSEKFLRAIFPPLMEGLKYIHEAGLLHLDIKPGNVHLRPRGKPLLIDFGAVHSMKDSRKKQHAQIVTPGFSPIEQYELGRGYVGPWTDIYALGATMRACIEGTSPPTAMDRSKKESVMKPASERFARNYSKELLQAIDWAMEMDQTLRPQKVDELIAILRAPIPDQDGRDGDGGVFDKLVNNFRKNR